MRNIMTRKKFINAKLKGYDELQEILVEDGVFKKIAPSIEVEGGCEIEDLGGKLTLPPYVDPHIHLDYVFTAKHLYFFCCTDCSFFQTLNFFFN